MIHDHWTLGALWILFQGLAAAVSYGGLVTLGLCAMIGFSLARGRARGRSERWGVGLPLSTAIGIACIGGWFDHSRSPGASSNHPVPAWAIVGLFSLGLILGVHAVIRAQGARLLVSSVVALELWYVLIVTAIALMTVTGEWPR